MDLDQLKNKWQEQELKIESSTETMDKVIQFDKGLEKENLRITIMFSVTIFILGFVVLPLLKSATEQLLIGALFFLMGFQALMLWMRNLNVRKSFAEAPAIYIKSLIKKLKFNLSVTIIITPVYLILLGTIVSLYTYKLMSSFAIDLSWIVLVNGLIWAYLLGIFIYSWGKQRKKDKTIIMPMIDELKETLKSY
ncbi:MAG: hypothetical protein R8P61_23420 [Bacteroidia bacterium]|nr:hypothetical protein [Bacteroidia bacterium]